MAGRDRRGAPWRSTVRARRCSAVARRGALWCKSTGHGTTHCNVVPAPMVTGASVPAHLCRPARTLGRTGMGMCASQPA
eukprot:9746442-Alexandrium_andersonii.AAC.1